MNEDTKSIQYILYGAGDWGKRTLEEVGEENVVAFVDKKKAGSTFCQKPVYAPAYLSTHFKNEKVIVSVSDADALDAIRDVLWQMEITFIEAEEYLARYSTEKTKKLSREQLEMPEIQYMRSKGKICMLPYPFCEYYKPESVHGGFDSSEELYYVWYKKKKLYMAKKYGRRQSMKITAELLAEQDDNSPHAYFDKNHKLRKDEVFVDVGAAEGMISLDVVDAVRNIVLFECDDIWQIPLAATFKPWSDKCRIINKMICACPRSDRETSLDAEFGNDKRSIFVKVDIEGGEERFLEGAKLTLEHGNARLSICCYHDDNHPAEMCEFLKNYGYTTRYSKGWMFLSGELRHGVIYAEKTCSS